MGEIGLAKGQFTLASSNIATGTQLAGGGSAIEIPIPPQRHAEGTFTIVSSMLPGDDDALTIISGIQVRMERLRSGRQDGGIA